MSVRTLFGVAGLLSLGVWIFQDFLYLQSTKLFLLVSLTLLLFWITSICIEKGIVRDLWGRIWESIVTISVILTATFFLLRLMPGGPFDDQIMVSPIQKEKLETYYGLHESLPKQYLNFVGKVLVGDLGSSFKQSDQKISDLLKETLPVTFRIGTLALLVALLLGLPLGILAASQTESPLDYLIRFFTVLSASTPAFFLAPLLVVVFSFWLDVLPPALWDGPSYYVLPVVTMSLRPLSTVIRIVRVSAVDVFQADFVQVARAKGLKESSVLFLHVLRNSLIPLASVIGPVAAGLLSGSFVVESIFAIPGLGGHLIEGVVNRDYPLIMALTLVYSLLLITANLLSDILVTLLDPRVDLA